MKKYTLEIIVFITGACVMILEMVGSRILAPHLGTSILVWTSLIGVILASLSLGYSWGGRLADKKPSYTQLGKIIFLSGCYVGLTAIAKTHLLYFIQFSLHDLRLASLAATLIIFAPPSVLLGMVSPYAVKLKMQTIATSGATVGNLYAISTVGSIFGTFIAGFYLIALLGNTSILFILAITIVAVSLLAAPKNFFFIKILAVSFFLISISLNHALRLALQKKGVIDIDTDYQRIISFETTDKKSNRPIRVIVTDPYGTQSAVFTDRDDDLVFEYAKYYRLTEHFVPHISRGMVIGGAGYTYPKDFLARFPKAKLDVVEIDPGMTELARQYFSLQSIQNEPRLAIYHMDGRRFLNTTAERYDVIFGDAFRSLYSLPYALTTKEAVQKMFERLNDNGAVFVNIVSAREGRRGAFLAAEYATYRSVFPQVYLFPVSDTRADEMQNIILVAKKSPQTILRTSVNKDLQPYLDRRLADWSPATPRPILTDDYAPVDQYILQTIL
ncbi:MAG: fused MFS/spermidine synthase [Candidatus Magasanikbacteria bacterium]|nr:fused MFS/spermidine synthase [Candidatus Magasanikbacteria bacterium]